MNFKNREVTCDPVFDDLNRKKEFSDKELCTIRKKFLQFAFISRVSLLVSERVDFIGLFFGLLIYIKTGSIYEFLYSFMFIVVLFKGTRVFVYKIMNKHLSMNKFSKALCMTPSYSLIGLSDRDAYNKMYEDFSKGVFKLFESGEKFLCTYTHEIVKINLDEMFDNENFNYNVEHKGRKPIMEKMLLIKFSELIKLYLSIGKESREFNKVKRLLRSSDVYKISVEKLN